ncbi:MAG: hypothetical protein JWP89_616 [Schlesneria sp.]|nr:hypothetical protein [Schlesneria sp.]
MIGKRADVRDIRYLRNSEVARDCTHLLDSVTNPHPLQKWTSLGSRILAFQKSMKRYQLILRKLIEFKPARLVPMEMPILKKVEPMRFIEIDFGR